MSFKKLSLSLAEALIEDLQPFTPFSMAVMAEYGKVAGYAPAYFEVRRDAQGFLRLCEILGLPGAYVEALALPELSPGRLIREEFFQGEKQALMEALTDLAAQIGDESEALLEDRVGAREPEFRRYFDKLLTRSGIDPQLLLTEARPTPPGGEKIYVAARHSAPLRDQLCGFLAESGFDPIVAPSRSAFDADRVARDLASCIGGVFGVTPPDGPAGAGAMAFEQLYSDILAEISLADSRMGRRLMILAQERLVQRLPDRLRDRSLFTMRDREMDELEFTLFKNVASRTPWLSR